MGNPHKPKLADMFREQVQMQASIDGDESDKHLQDITKGYKGIQSLRAFRRAGPKDQHTDVLSRLSYSTGRAHRAHHNTQVEHTVHMHSTMHRLNTQCISQC